MSDRHSPPPKRKRVATESESTPSGLLAPEQTEQDVRQTVGQSEGTHSPKRKKRKLSGGKVPVPVDLAKEWRVTGAHSEESWRQYITHWSDIGEQLTIPLPPDQPLLASERHFFESHGFRFGNNLGSGKFGTVWQCWVRDSTGAERLMACKVMNIEYHHQKQRTIDASVEAILKESVILKDLNHPNVVSVEQVFKIPDPDSGFPFMRVLLIMEYCSGDLMKLLAANNGKLSEDMARDVMLDVCQGLKYLHEQNVVHMDIKPGNILYTTVEETGKYRYKLTDFGIARKFPHGTAPSVGKYRGTPVFKAPELSLSLPSDARKADIYSLGTTLVFLLVGMLDTIDCRQDIVSTQCESSAIQRIATKWQISVAVIELLALMVGPDVSLRPFIDGVVNSKWLSSDKSDKGRGFGCTVS